MAGAFAKDFAGKDTEIVCTGDKHQTIQRIAVRMMEEFGKKIPPKVTYTLNQIKSEPFDIVITLCNELVEKLV